MTLPSAPTLLQGILPADASPEEFDKLTISWSSLTKNLLQQERSGEDPRNISIQVSLFNSITDKIPKQSKKTLLELFGHIPRKVDRKESVGLFSLAQYKFNAFRCADSVESVTGIVLDFDHMTPSNLAQLTDPLNQFCSILYTSFRHQPHLPRFRIVLPLVRPVSVDEFRQLWPIVRRLFGNFSDTSPSSTASMFYLPCSPPSNLDQAMLIYLPGKLLDPDSYDLKAKKDFSQQEFKAREGGLSIEGLFLVLKRCEAFRSIQAKTFSPQNVLRHHEGTALHALSLQFKGGDAWFREHTPGWPKSERDVAQLNNNAVTFKAPYSCEAMRRYGLCPHPDTSKCFKPRTSTRSRSPIAFAYMTVRAVKVGSPIVFSGGINHDEA